MTNTTNVLTQDIQNILYPYQIDKINRQVKDYVHLNKKAKSFSFDICPKCGAIHPSFGKGGYTKAGKPMIKCLECGRRFVYDYGQLTYYSHQSQDKWDDFIIETQKGESLKKTAALIDVHETTAFRMRHKYLHSLEQLELPIYTEKSDRIR